jgi:ASC-1-like (ASCH) protein
MIELVFEDKIYQDIKNGKKKTIGDIDVELSKIKKGDTVIFKNIGTNTIEKISVKVKDIHKFNDVSAMLKEMKLKTILPRSKSYKDGEKFFEEKYGNKLKDSKFIAFTFDILENTLKAPPGFIIRTSVSSNSKGPIINFQPENEAELHMQERHERFNRNALGPRINNEDKDEDEDEDVFGPRIKNKKNDEFSGPRIKKKKNDDFSGPRIKKKKNDDFSGPRIKNKKNDDFSGPRIKNKKNDDFSGSYNSNRPAREFEITIKDPWFSLIENGQKTVEARLFKGIFTQFRVNDTIRFINRWNGIEKSVLVKITKLTKYPNFGDLLFSEQLYKVLPGIPNIKCGITVYDKIYKDFSEIKEHGTLAIELELV